MAILLKMRRVHKNTYFWFWLIYLKLNLSLNDCVFWHRFGKVLFDIRLGRGGGQVISVLTSSSDDPSSNPAEAYRFFCNSVLEKTKTNKKEAGVGLFFKKLRFKSYSKTGPQSVVFYFAKDAYHAYHMSARYSTIANLKLKILNQFSFLELFVRKVRNNERFI